MVLSVIGWVFIGVGIFLLFLFSTIGILLYRKMVTNRVTKAFIIHPDQKLEIIKLSNVKETFKTGHNKDDSCEYVFDKQAILKRTFQDHVFYFYNNPLPIKFNAQEHKVDMTSKNLHNIIQHSLIDKLFKGVFDDFLSPQMLVLYAIVLGVGVLVFLQLTQDKGVSLMHNNQTLRVIADGVRVALQ